MLAALRFFVLVALGLTGAAIILVAGRPFGLPGGLRAVAAGWGEQVRGSGDVVADTRSVPAFHAIVVAGSTDVHVRVGGAQSVVVRAQQNIANLIDTTVEDGTLRISSHGSFSTEKQTVVDIVVPSIDELSSRGSADVTLDGLRGPALAIRIAGSGNVHATGSVDSLRFDCSGSGDGRLEGLATRDAVVRVRGSGTAKLRVADTLDVEISGSGDVYYAGSARVVHESIRGSGDLARM